MFLRPFSHSTLTVLRAEWVAGVNSSKTTPVLPGPPGNSKVKLIQKPGRRRHTILPSVHVVILPAQRGLFCAVPAISFNFSASVFDWPYWTSGNSNLVKQRRRHIHLNLQIFWYSSPALYVYILIHKMATSFCSHNSHANSLHWITTSRFGV